LNISKISKEKSKKNCLISKEILMFKFLKICPKDPNIRTIIEKITGGTNIEEETNDMETEDPIIEKIIEIMRMKE
jgi:hypothetical protein